MRKVRNSQFLDVHICEILSKVSSIIIKQFLCRIMMIDCLSDSTDSSVKYITL